MSPDRPPPSQLRELRFQALGTTCHLLALGVAGERLEKGAAWVAAMHHRLSRFEPESELSRFNASAGGWTEVSPELEDLLREALRAHEASGGLVHAGILASMTAIGYSRPLREGPTPAVLEKARPPAPLPHLLEVAPGRARLEPGAGVDLGGLAKGWMADRLGERLGPNSLANLGGDLFARGTGPGGEGWPVGMGGVTVMLEDAGAATSGTRRRRWTWGEQPLHHLIDPRTGRPAATGLEEVSVVAGSALEAEVCAKAALLLGAERAPAFLAARTRGWWAR